jgi:hypothetical protein
MTKNVMRMALATSSLMLLALAQPSQAKLINVLAGGGQLSFAGDFESKRLDDGRYTRDYQGFTFAAEPAPRTTNTFVRTSFPTANFGANGQWAGPMMLNSGGGRALFEFAFDTEQAAVLFDLNWIPGFTGVSDFQLSIFDSSNRLLETATIAYGGRPGFFGFGERQSADIARLTVTGSVFGIRNLKVSDVVAGVPEPSTWAAMVLGFLSIGGVLRSKRAPRPLAA